MALSGQLPCPLDQVPAQSSLIECRVHVYVCVFMCQRLSPGVNQLNHRFAVFQLQIANIYQQIGALLSNELEMCGK